MNDAPAGALLPDRAARVGGLLARTLLLCGAAILFAMLALTCVDVAGRYLLNAPVNGKTEITRFMMAGLIACTLPVVSVTGEQITVDLLDRFFRARAAAIQELVIDLIACFALAVLANWVLFRAARLLKRGYVSDFLSLPLYPVAYFIGAMVFLSALALACKLVVDAYYVAHPEARPERRASAIAG